MDALKNRRHFNFVYAAYYVFCCFLLAFVIIPPILVDTPGVLVAVLGMWLAAFKSKGQASIGAYMWYWHLLISAIIYCVYGFTREGYENTGIVVLGALFIPYVILIIHYMLFNTRKIQELLGFCSYKELVNIKKHGKFLQSRQSASISDAEAQGKQQDALFALGDDDKEYICQHIKAALFAMHPKNKRTVICCILSISGFTCLLLGVNSSSLVLFSNFIGLYAMISGALICVEVL